eukprot:2923166-Pyramimonas_sp.AAC.1
MAKMDKTTSMLQEPRSTMSPLKTTGLLGPGGPVMPRVVNRSQYWPCVSPTTDTLPPLGMLRET